jgi:hypothetical protein
VPDLSLRKRHSGRDDSNAFPESGASRNRASLTEPGTIHFSANCRFYNHKRGGVGCDSLMITVTAVVLIL